ncbi:MAG: hypothetical protein IJZ59_03000 [Alphaproteobacteria bacterium]|nr:hypothetical protein [Alphaproteobacteria bacterium]
MNMELITAKKTKVSPQNITDGMYNLVNLLSNTDLNNKQSILIYNILYGAYALLKRYEAASRESILVASIEDNDNNMRKYIEILHKNALHDDVTIPMIVAENIDI